MGNGVRALTRTRTLLAEAQGASLSQQIRVGGGKKCPEGSSESGFLADRSITGTDTPGDLNIHQSQSHRVRPNIVLFPEPPLQP